MNLAALSLLLFPFAVTPADDPRNDHSTNLVEVASEAGTFQTLLAAAQAAGLADTLATGGPFTLFAPTDDAFAKLPQEAVAALLLPENKDKLVEVLSYHVVSGKVSAAEAIGAGEAGTLSGQTVAFRIDGGRLRVNEAGVVANDLPASNGVIHVIDSVLAPPTGLAPAPRGRLVIGVYTERPSQALCEQLGIDRHGSLVLTSLTKDGPAREAGLEKYDVITSVDGRPATSEELKEAKLRVGLGNPLEIGYLRRGIPATLHVEVGAERH